MKWNGSIYYYVISQDNIGVGRAVLQLPLCWDLSLLITHSNGGDKRAGEPPPSGTLFHAGRQLNPSQIWIGSDETLLEIPACFIFPCRACFICRYTSKTEKEANHKHFHQAGDHLAQSDGPPRGSLHSRSLPINSEQSPIL